MSGIPADVPQTEYSYVDKSSGRVASFTPKPDEAMVRLRRPATTDTLEAIVADGPLLSVSCGFNIGRGFAAVFVNPGFDVETAADSLGARADVDDAMPVMIDGNGAARYFLPDELTVQFRDADRAVGIIEELGSSVVVTQRTPGYYTISVPEGQSLFAAIRAFSAREEVAFAEPSEAGFNDALYLPDDADFGELWGLRNTGQTVNGTAGTAGADIRVTEAWDHTRGDPEVVIAVIDTGADTDHDDLEANILPRGTEDWDFADAGDPDPDDANGHGSHVSGTVAAVDNAVGVIGVAPGCRVMPLRVDLTAGMNQNRADAINYVRTRAVNEPGRRYVVNCSWRMNGDHAGVGTAIQDAVRTGVVIVFAAGNNGTNTDTNPQFPGVYPEVIAVAALDQRDKRAPFSNFGTNVDVAAPGVNIRSTLPGNTYGFLGGTSMAAPHVAGVAALVWSRNRNLTNHQVRSIIESTCDNIDASNPGLVGVLGRGRINALSAVTSPKLFPRSRPTARI